MKEMKSSPNAHLEPANCESPSLAQRLRSALESADWKHPQRLAIERYRDSSGNCFSFSVQLNPATTYSQLCALDLRDLSEDSDKLEQVLELPEGVPLEVWSETTSDLFDRLRVGSRTIPAEVVGVIDPDGRTFPIEGGLALLNVHLEQIEVHAGEFPQRPKSAKALAKFTLSQRLRHGYWLHRANLVDGKFAGFRLASVAGTQP